MHGQERRRLATGTFIKFDHSYADTIAELGYPTRSALRRGGTGTRGPARCPQAGLPRTRGTPPRRGGEPPGTTPGTAGARQGRRGPSATPRAARGPASGPAGSRRDGEGTGAREGGDSPEGRVRVVAGPGARDGSAAEIAERHGVSGTAPYPRHGEMMGDSGGEPERKGEPAGRGSGDLPDGAGVVAGRAARGEDAAREGAAAAGRPPGGPGMAGKGPDADPELPADAEKAAMATVPGDKHGLCEALPAAGMDRGGHGCARGARPGGETEEHAAAGRPWRGHPGPVAAPCGHGRAAARADAGGEPGGRVGGRAAHDVMGGEGLVARVARRRRRHGSHGGGVPGAPPNLLRDERGRHDLGADAPNEKWVTDAAGSRAPAGRACLSPVAGRLDGMPPGRAVPASPDAGTADPSLPGACEWLRGGDRTAARPDRGGRHRWPGRVGICEADGLAGSMSRKGARP